MAEGSDHQRDEPIGVDALAVGGDTKALYQVFGARHRTRSRSVRRRAGKEGLGVAVENLLVDVFGIAEAAPIVDQALERERRPIPAEHDAVLQAAADFLLQCRGKIFWRAAVQLVADVGL